MIEKETDKDCFELLYSVMANEAAPKSKNPILLKAYSEYMQSKTAHYPAENPQISLIIKEREESFARNYVCNMFAESVSDREEYVRLKQKYTPDSWAKQVAKDEWKRSDEYRLMFKSGR